jgi:hypothetical protein
MQIARYINVAVWFYLWASDVLNPIATKGDFWTEKAKQALRLNQNTSMTRFACWETRSFSEAKDLLGELVDA